MDARVALVTGASRGLGRAIATELGVSGFDVVVTYEQQADLASEVSSSIVAAGRKSFATQLDVVDGRAVDGVIQQVIGEFGRLDVLVCNAGIFSRSLIVDTTDEEFTRTFDVNVRGVFNCLRAALPVMYEQRSGRIITISSHNAKRGTGASSKATYAATKNAVESYTKGAAVEAAPYGVTVNCVSPGWTQPFVKDREWSEAEQGLLAGIPLHRPGLPEEIAAAVVYLASERAAYVTGETLDVNGGTWMD